MATRAKNQVINLPFVKGEPIRFSGELANAPSYGSGCVKVREEVLMPLENVENPVGGPGINFWPFLTSDGIIRWFWEYTFGDPGELGFSRIE